MVVEEADDLDLAAIREVPLGRVGLPHLIGLVRLEAYVAGLRALLRLRGDEALPHQDAVDRGRRRGVAELAPEVDLHGGRPSVGAVLQELLAEQHDPVLDVRRGLVRVGAMRSGARYKASAPPSRNRLTSLATKVLDTPKLAATSRTLRPSRTTASTTICRMTIDAPPQEVSPLVPDGSVPDEVESDTLTSTEEFLAFLPAVRSR